MSAGPIAIAVDYLEPHDHVRVYRERQHDALQRARAMRGLDRRGPGRPRGW